MIPSSPPRSGAARWRDRLVAEDPGGFSRRGALRAFLSFLATGGLLLATRAPLMATLIGASMAMTISVSVSEADPAAQAISMALASVAAIAAVCLAALVSATPWAASALLCAVVFLSVVTRARGPRATAVGMLAFMGYFFALFVAAQSAQIPLLAGAVAAGGIAAFVVRFGFVRESTAHVHASVLRAFRARVLLLFDDLVMELESGEANDRRLQRIRRQTGRVNETALALEEVAGRSADESPADAARKWLLQLLDAEVAVDMLADAVHRIAGRERADVRRRALAATVRALQRWIGDGSADTPAEVRRLLVVAERDGPPGREAHAREALETEEREWERAERAVNLLLTGRPWAAFPVLPPAATRVSLASFRPGGGGTAGLHGSWPSLRLAAQATIAVALAIVAGRAISVQRWYWAVLAAFVVFIRATTVAETLSRAWQRVAGTVLGVTAGTLIAELLRRHGTLAIVVALLAVLVAYALLRVSYGGMILFITIALALLYEMMGREVPGLMELRLAETAAGAAIGVIVAAVVFPMHSAIRLRRLVADVVREAAQVLAVGTAPRVASRGETGNDDSVDAVLHDRIRSVDRALAEVRNAVRPLWAPQVPWESKRLTRLARAAAELAYLTRRVRTLRETAAADDASTLDMLQRLGAALAQNCEAVADTLGARGEPKLVQVEPLIAALESTNDGTGRGASLHEVAELYRDMSTLIQRLAATAEEGQASLVASQSYRASLIGRQSGRGVG
jgi:uncharacterized membrane protein YccC